METRPARFSPEIRRALRVDVSAALLFTVFASLTTPFIGLILRRELGATPLQLSVMSAAGGACLLLSLAWARALCGHAPLPYLVWPSFVARGLFLLMPLASSAWLFVSLIVATNVFGAAAAPAQAAVVERLYRRAARGRALGLVRMAGAALGVGLALAAGQLFERVDYRVIFPVAAVLGMAPACASGTCRSRRPRRTGRGPSAGSVRPGQRSGTTTCSGGSWSRRFSSAPAAGSRRLRIRCSSSTSCM